MPALKISRQEALERIGELFRRHGYDGASISRLCEATGLGRASLYHHFPGGKQEITRAVFRLMGGRIQSEILAPLLDRDRQIPARERLQRWAAAVSRLYDKGKKNCLLGTLLLGGGSELFADELRQSMRAWTTALAGVLVAEGFSRSIARRRAEDAVGRIQGALIVSRGLQSNAPFRRAIERLPGELIAPEIR